MTETTSERLPVGWYTTSEGVRRFWDGTAWYRPSAADLKRLANSITAQSRSTTAARSVTPMGE
ncbi:MAG: hypothetical protein JWP30_497 [Homoserinimonas sp.]|jgi:hypothetical protein|nr:hypothetical protein [Homoserinimonas sp.]